MLTGGIQIRPGHCLPRPRYGGDDGDFRGDNNMKFINIMRVWSWRENEEKSLNRIQETKPRRMRGSWVTGAGGRWRRWREKHDVICRTHKIWKTSGWIRTMDFKSDGYEQLGWRGFMRFHHANIKCILVGMNFIYIIDLLNNMIS
jgi:hypothetical protein